MLASPIGGIPGAPVGGPCCNDLARSLKQFFLFLNLPSLPLGRICLHRFHSARADCFAPSDFARSLKQFFLFLNLPLLPLGLICLQARSAAVSPCIPGAPGGAIVGGIPGAPIIGGIPGAPVGGPCCNDLARSLKQFFLFLNLPSLPLGRICLHRFHSARADCFAPSDFARSLKQFFLFLNLPLLPLGLICLQARSAAVSPCIPGAPIVGGIPGAPIVGGIPGGPVGGI